MRMKRFLAVTLAALAVGAGWTVASHAQGEAPLNDHYLESLALNQDGTRLERTDTLKDVRDTTNATVQPDVFSPPRSGGPAEATTCEGSNYGKTIWYDFYPDVPGIARIRANGYDAVISVVQFDRRTAMPKFDRRACINDSTSTQEELLTRVKAGRAYTIQLGGVNNASGQLEFLFDFLADTDGDGVLDDVDRCPKRDGGGRTSGCPRTLHADVLLRAQAIEGGIKVLRLTVTAPRKSRVAVSCTEGCKTQVKRAHSKVRFPKLHNAKLPAGSKLAIRVTRRGAIGAYIAYKIRDGNFTKIERCLNPGSRKPRRRCR
jgi:hypothetical protein